nr:polysaccharide biosynthesis C-terminal domain-containing protein [Aridibaculum aurantiacum]
MTRWFALSCFLRVLCWPLGYIIIAKAKKTMFVVTSILWEMVHIPIIFVCLHFWGLNGIGISYVIDYLVVLVGASFITYKYFNFTWSNDTYKSVAISVLLVAGIVLLNVLHVKPIIFYLTGALLIGISLFRMVIIAQKKLGINLVNYIRRR